MHINKISALHAYALASVVIFSSFPIVYAIKFGLTSSEHWAGGVRLGYFSLIACFFVVFASAGKLLYRTCRNVIDILSSAPANKELIGPEKLESSSISVVLVGLVFIQALAQIGRYFFVDAQSTSLLANPSAIIGVVLINCFLAPIVETLIFVGAIEIARKWLPNAVTVILSSLLLSAIHGAFEYYWAIPAFVLFAYSGAVYVHKARSTSRWRAVVLILSIHTVNNLFGIALIFGREGVVG